jgi:transcription antitermination factor NusG
MTMTPHWAVAVVQTSREDFVQKLLKRDGFETYLPKVKAAKRIASLFPGYLMVRVVVRWYPIRWCPGVLKVLMNGEHPAKLADSVVDEIRGREVRGYVKLPKKPTLANGASVLVTRGTFMGHVGIYDGMDGTQRERVLLELLGQAVTVKMPLGSVEAIG